jgi:uncharacterized damage-inducible protein DinB
VFEDERAADFLREHDIKAVPVVVVRNEIIVGFDERRLTEVLGLRELTSTGGTAWLASKYEIVFDALVRAVRELGQSRIDLFFAQRQMSVRAHVVHIISFAEGGYLTHTRGRFDADDMLATAMRSAEISSVDDVCDYADRVVRDIANFLRSANPASLDRVVTSHYGGQVSVLEVLRIMLRHSTHHVKQLRWFMESELGIGSESALTAEDLAGIAVPNELFGGASQESTGG